MAHFAELESKTDPTGFTSDTHLVVKRVVVVANDEVPSDEHVDGETWCVNFFKGGTWKQTSYNHNFRKQYAGVGMVYDASKNKFLSPQPYASWSLDGSDDWQAPVTYPNGDQSAYYITWDEDNLRWLGTKLSDNSNYRWDADNTQWVSV
jgi:hypothetical protein|tara:strand:+ start:380 stop:826 length:447 start_codon:yes stop_codon:yes gene_type:complete